MIVIDDNKTKLLRMKEKLLEMSLNKNNKILDEYKDIVIDIDKDIYNFVYNEIKTSNYYDKPLIEQIKILNEIYDDCVYLNNFQQKHIKIYQNYANERLILSPINSIKIKNIQSRISFITQYINNNENIEKNKKELELLNSKLIEEDKKNNLLIAKIEKFDEELKNNTLLAEGRIKNQNNEIEYTSIIEEANKLNIELKLALNNKDVMAIELKNADEMYREAEEELKAVKICYESTANSNYEDIYNNTKQKELYARYKLLFLKITDLIPQKYKTFDSSIQKRNTLLNLINERINILKELNIEYLYDPFDRIGIKNQIEVIKSIGNNNDRIKSIRKSIEEVMRQNEFMIKINTELMNLISKNSDLIVDKTKLSDIIEDDITKNIYNKKLPNQVISIEYAKSELFAPIIRNKANGVIKRVYEMLFDINPIKEDDGTSPELIIEQEEILEENIEIPDLSINIESTLPEEIDNQEKEIINEQEIKTNKEETPEIKIEEPKPEEKIILKEESPKEVINLFQEVEPFESTMLFDNRTDDDVIDTSKDKIRNMKIDLTNQKVPKVPQIPVTEEKSIKEENITENQIEDNLENTMPDIFWLTKEDTQVEPEEKKLSFDEQIEALVGETNQKTKKLSA